MKNSWLFILIFISHSLVSQNLENPYLNSNNASLTKSPKSWMNKYLNLLGKSIDDSEVKLFVKAIEHKIPKDSLVLKDNYISEGNDFDLIWIHGILYKIRIGNAISKEYSKFEAINYMKKYSLKDYMKDGIETKSKNAFKLNVNDKKIEMSFLSKGNIRKKKPYQIELYYINFPKKLVFAEFDKKLGNNKFKYDYLLLLNGKRFGSYLAQYYFIKNKNHFIFNEESFMYTLKNKGVNFKFYRYKGYKTPSKNQSVSSINFDINNVKELPGGVKIEDFLQSYKTGKYDKIKSSYKKTSFIDYKVTCDKKNFEIHKHLIVALKNNEGFLEAKGIEGFPSTFKLNYYSFSFKEAVRKAYRNRDRLNRVFNSNRCVTNKIRKENNENFYSAIPLEKITLLVKDDFNSISFLNSNYAANKTLRVPNAKKSYYETKNNGSRDFIIEFNSDKKIAKYLQTKRKKRVKDLTISNYESNIGALIYKREFIGTVSQKENKVIFNSYSENDFFNQIYNFLNTEISVSNNFLFNESITSKKNEGQIIEYTLNNSKRNPYYFQNYLSCSYLNMRSENFKNKYKVGFKESFITQIFENQISKAVCNVHFTLKNKSALLSFNNLNKERDNFTLIIGPTVTIEQMIKRQKQKSNQTIVMIEAKKSKDRYLDNLKRKEQGKDPIFTQNEILEFYTSKSNYKQLKSGYITKSDFNKLDNVFVSSPSTIVTILVKTNYSDCQFNVYAQKTYEKKVGKKFKGNDGYYKQKYNAETITINDDLKSYINKNGYTGNGTVALASFNLENLAFTTYKKGVKHYNTKIRIKPTKCNRPIKGFTYYLLNDKAQLKYQEKIKNYKNSPYNKNKGLMNLIRKQKKN